MLGGTVASTRDMSPSDVLAAPRYPGRPNSLRSPRGSDDEAHLVLGDLLVILVILGLLVILGRVRVLSGPLDRVHGLLGPEDLLTRIAVPAE